jgi:hypothetical protein
MDEARLSQCRQNPEGWERISCRATTPMRVSRRPESERLAADAIGELGEAVGE